MTQRFLWNFELNPTNPLILPEIQHTEFSDMHWEFRFFWKKYEIILLNGLDETFLDLAHYQIKLKSDLYYLLPDANYNLKLRKETLFYKPTLGKTIMAMAYGKKINLTEQPNNTTLPGIPNVDTQTLLAQIHQQGRKVTVHKEALIYRIETTPKTKLEIAKIRVHNETYFSVSIESPIQSHVTSLSKQLLGDLTSCDYITFLKAR